MWDRIKPGTKIRVRQPGGAGNLANGTILTIHGFYEPAKLATFIEVHIAGPHQWQLSYKFPGWNDYWWEFVEENFDEVFATKDVSKISSYLKNKVNQEYAKT